MEFAVIGLSRDTYLLVLATLTDVGYHSFDFDHQLYDGRAVVVAIAMYESNVAMEGRHAAIYAVNVPTMSTKDTKDKEVMAISNI